MKKLSLIAAAALSILATDSLAQEARDVIVTEPEAVLNVFQPSTADQSKPGVGKFVVFTREPVGKEGDFIAGAWECIPSRPGTPITKRVEFRHSSWNCAPLLDVLAADNSNGMHPRFVTLGADSGDRGYIEYLYDINYRTWDVRCIWQGSRLRAFGAIGDSIFCRSENGWLLLNADSGKLNPEVPFTPLDTDGAFWLVRKPGETKGCWSYEPKEGQYIAHFGHVDRPTNGFSRSKLSPDGKSRAWVVAFKPVGWRRGALAGQLILQRASEEVDVSGPIEIQAGAGSGVPVIPIGVQLMFSPDGKAQLRAWKGDNKTEERVWSIDVATGELNASVALRSQPAVDAAFLDGVPVPEYLREHAKDLTHFGRSGLAPAFLLHLGIIKERPEYPDCTAGVSRDGRHVLYRAKGGPLAGVFIYGDLLTRKTVRWESPAGLGSYDCEEFIWVETPE